jgi:hypothetical protein
MAAAASPLPPPPTAAAAADDGDCAAKPWVVLVAGESPGVMFKKVDGRPGADLSGHTSLCHIGQAYEQLVPLVGRERIVVIAQLQESLDWLRDCVSSPERCRAMTGLAPERDVSRLFQSNKDRLANIQRDCACLIADGGASYDFGHVNPATVIHVITGEPRREGDHVVPKGTPCSSLLLLMCVAHPISPAVLRHCLSRS